MKTDTYTKVLLTLIAVLLFVLCLQNFGLIGVSRVAIDSNDRVLQVEIYRNGKPIGEGLRELRGNPLPVELMGP